MIKKIQVLVREVYEIEEFEVKIRNNKTAQEIDSYDFKKLDATEQEKYTFGEYPTGKSKVEIADGDPTFSQIFTPNDFSVKDLILHLNRTK